MTREQQVTVQRSWLDYRTRPTRNEQLYGFRMSPRLNQRTKVYEHKSNTLMSRLEKAGEEQREAVLHEFYAEHPLGHDVAQGKESFAKRVQPIVERYDSKWSRFFVHHDPKFDKSMEPTLEVLAEVGTRIEIDRKTLTAEGEYVTQTERRPGFGINAAAYGTEFIRGMSQRNDSRWVTFGALTFAANAVLLTMPTMYVEAGTATYAAAWAIAAITGPIAVGLHRSIEVSNIRLKMEYLQEKATEADTFLRENYVPLPQK